MCYDDEDEGFEYQPLSNEDLIRGLEAYDRATEIFKEDLRLGTRIKCSVCGNYSLLYDNDGEYDSEGRFTCSICKAKDHIRKEIERNCYALIKDLQDTVHYVSSGEDVFAAAEYLATHLRHLEAMQKEVEALINQAKEIWKKEMVRMVRVDGKGELNINKQDY